MLAAREICTGCGVCKLVCSKNCISMQKDALGFFYPVIDKDRCVSCGKCQKVCPVLNPESKKNEQSVVKCMVGVHKSEGILLNSSSGGAFTAIAEAFCDEEYIICGAAYTDKLEVCHTYVNDIKDIDRLRKSKYTQSRLDDIFVVVKNKLNEGKKVLFTGTPCQIAGLRKYLGREYDNLLLIDILCEGVCSPKLLEKHIEYLETGKEKHVAMYDMRTKEKQPDHTWRVMEVKIKYEDGSLEQNEKDLNLFKKVFSQKNMYRESCYHCRYANLSRVGDITIGDWWGNSPGSSGEFKGASVIMFNNNKFPDIETKLKEIMDVMEVSREAIVQQQHILRKPTDKPKRMKEMKIPDSVSDKRYLSYLKRYSKPELKIRVLQKISRLFPDAISTRLKRIYYGMIKRK